MAKKRKANCAYGNHGIVDSDSSLAFFVDRSEGSKYALNDCAFVRSDKSVCHYAPEAHSLNPRAHLVGKTDHAFVPSKGRETDTYYCGCYGWN